jgi:hypothetical protein
VFEVLIIVGIFMLVAVFAVCYRLILGNDEAAWTNLTPFLTMQEERDYAYHIAVLGFCIQELEKREGEDGFSNYIWESKLKIARLMGRKLSNQMESELVVTLTDRNRDDILESHPLLKLDEAIPPDASKQYAHQQWYRDLCVKVETFSEKRAVESSKADF